MPFWGLVCTSLGFLIPAWLAHRRRKKALSNTFKVLATTSALYHGTQHPVCHVIDACYVHGMAVIISIKSLWSCVRNPSLLKGALMTTISIPLYIYYGKSLQTKTPESALWHMLFHVTSQGCLAAHVVYF